MKQTYRIGMYGGYDHKKFVRDYIPPIIQGIEVCSFETMEDVHTLIKEKARHRFTVGVHFPLYKGSYKQRDPLFLHKDKQEREAAFLAIENELVLAKMVEAEYMLMHFPKPMLLNTELPWHLAVVQDHECYPEDELSKVQFESFCLQCIKRLNGLSEKHAIPIVLELDLLNDYLNDGLFLKNALETYSNIKVCLDSARMHVNAIVDKNFDMSKLVRRLSPYTRVLHLSNVGINDQGLFNRHHPVMASEQVIEGYGDTALFMKTFMTGQQPEQLNILFEHQSQRITEIELLNCYQWVKEHLSE